MNNLTGKTFIRTHTIPIVYGKFYSLPLFILVFLFTGLFVRAQQTKNTPSLKEYHTVQYITAKQWSPRQVMFLDNNDAILLACVEGKTREQLSALKVPVTESQIALLKMMRLLEEKDHVLHTSFPILNTGKTALLRQQADVATSLIYTSIKEEVSALIKLLEAEHLQQHAYSILFSYLFDGLVWDKLHENHLIHKLEVSADTPFWDGEVWSVYPKRTFYCGTNTTGLNGIYLSLNWSEHAPDFIWDFWNDNVNLKQMMHDVADAGKVLHESVISAFTKYRLTDNQGNLTVPVITTEPGDPLFDLCNELAEKTAEALPQTLNLKQLSGKIGLENSEETLILAYHEVIWDLMKKLEREKVVTKPVAFSHPEKAGEGTLSDLVFIIKSR